MCGITGFIGDTDALSKIVRGLYRLEYRGYDSAGVALLEGDPADLAVYKSAGRVGDLEVPTVSDATCGIGHTRWSTHGKPTDENAHPHTDCTEHFAVVHNGVIANYDELRGDLETHEFTSQTDTEVVPHLLEEEYSETSDLRAAVESVTDRLEGSYALGVIAEESDRIVCARHNSPLVVGHGEDGNYIASDVTAFLDQTRDASYLLDGDVAVVSDDDVTVYADGEPVDRPIQHIEWDAQAAEKDGYQHFMRKEIHEQPWALRQVLASHVDTVDRTVDLDIDLDDDYLRNVDEIQLVACGTSYHASLYAKYLFQTLANVRTSVEVASEYEFEGGRDPTRTLVAGVTQSGETADTLDAVRRSAANGATTLGVTNSLGSTITRVVDDSIFIRAGPEIGVAATKTFSSQIATLVLLCLHVADVRGELDSADGRRLLENLRNLPSAIQQALDNESRIQAVADRYLDEDAFFYIGRRMGNPVSLEGALKLKEISYDHAEGFPAGELKHGPLALITEETPVIALLTDGSRPDDTITNVKEVQARGAPVIGLASEGTGNGTLEERIEVPSLGRLEPLVANVYLQLFAYHLADQKGRPIDKPRNLAKSVTVR
ncbi:glutamine--fructose-6-phosphate transaminase (isomerizing) [Natronoglomus mannanivorans]|uniref:Glutamine--fructose-6-phosphate aminotransferase [isomerizing] n=1 Tax=Natronoglomus mannanivorans TaxID=2979990 RepID=A0AAP2Z048_9EURY|nr:glutamine--fructose-6-phosphate transaminase (isomerizing) [Halobacteria archaeon AArc-xg1-1]